MGLEEQIALSLRLLAAAFLTAVIGINRERNEHAAGLRTHMLVGMGSALFTMLSLYAFDKADTSRVAAQIVTGIGFLGAGTIVQRRERGVKGMTTAAGIWATAAVGMACGAGLLLLAAIATILYWVVLALIGAYEARYMTNSTPESDETGPDSKDAISNHGNTDSPDNDHDVDNWRKRIPKV
jgi:putative Mg2+ transporter-C (MgtC) family protein